MIIKKRILPALLILAVMLSMVAPAMAAQTVNPASATVRVNGKLVNLEAYTIDGNNYFKLRDLAMVLTPSKKQFSVGWDSAANAITLTMGQPYEAVGGELAQGDGKPKTAVPTCVS